MKRAKVMPPLRSISRWMSCEIGEVSRSVTQLPRHPVRMAQDLMLREYRQLAVGPDGYPKT
jgi:hypothetical protein